MQLNVLGLKFPIISHLLSFFDACLLSLDLTLKDWIKERQSRQVHERREWPKLHRFGRTFGRESDPCAFGKIRNPLGQAVNVPLQVNLFRGLLTVRNAFCVPADVLVWSHAESCQVFLPRV